MKRKIMYLVVTFLLVMICVILYLSGVGMHAQLQLSDRLYQQGEGTTGEIFLIEIDEKSLEELGPYQTWTREYVAEAVRRLNADTKNKPAVIGIDVLYIGQTTREADQALVQACAEGKNVVAGSLLNLDTAMLENADGSYYLGSHISGYEEPYEPLKEVTTQGFVNGFFDEDGTIRHGLLEMELEDGERIPSFAYAVYQRYAEAYQLEESLKIPTNQDGMWYIPFQAQPQGYSNSYSLSDLIQGELPTDRLGGAIVLIGPYAEGLMDSYRTAIDHTEPMYGVEIHANMIDAMIKQEYKTEITKEIQAVLLALVILLGCFFCQKGSLRYCVGYAAVCCILYPFAAVWCYQKGIVLDILYIPAVSFGITVYSVGMHYVKELFRKKQVERTFKRYVDPEIVDEIIKTGMDKVELGGATVDIACLFVDIRGFTSMSEQIPPEEVVGILNQYLNLTSSCIFRHHGTLDKFIGDSTMALFNVPIPQEDYVYQAVLTAWDMVKESEKLGQELLDRFGRTVQFGIGVHCGAAVVGNIGTEKRMDYTAIGDTVNTAARLESNAPRGTILISNDVYQRLKGRIEVESCGNIPLKGKSKELEVFKVTGIIS